MSARAETSWMRTLVRPNADQCSLCSPSRRPATLRASRCRSRTSAAWFSSAAAMLPLSSSMPKAEIKARSPPARCGSRRPAPAATLTTGTRALPGAAQGWGPPPRRTTDECQVAGRLGHLDTAVGGEPAEVGVAQLEGRGRGELVRPGQPDLGLAALVAFELPDRSLGVPDQVGQEL